ncbi:hypothetical protein [Stenotrophomonas phage YB07]|uniref:Uncharacterized protein n=1 Tax=Stenotrophomonas phage YB07 TaxID=2555548 RepID=A0A482IEE7_9CAUD|nr:hypothetical protein HWC11_gp106 [Stenotrophomonas phage YB07]QBP06302.1 hypothetical protein [Stenotrophomonas phage YB07]
MVRVSLLSYFGTPIWSELVAGITLEQLCELSKVLIQHSPGRSWYHDAENTGFVQVKLGDVTLELVPGETVRIECCGE